jgi:excisionase family DNA binding protein
MITSTDQKNDQFLTVNEVARKYRISIQAVYGWIYRGQLEAYNIGGRVRIKPEALNNVITRKNPTG